MQKSQKLWAYHKAKLAVRELSEIYVSLPRGEGLLAADVIEAYVHANSAMIRLWRECSGKISRNAAEIIMAEAGVIGVCRVQARDFLDMYGLAIPWLGSYGRNGFHCDALSALVNGHDGPSRQKMYFGCLGGVNEDGVDVCTHCGRASCASIEHMPFRCDDYDGSVEVISPSVLRGQYWDRVTEWAKIDEPEIGGEDR